MRGRLHCSTSPATKSEEKRMFSQASCIGVSLIQSKIFEVVVTASKLLFVTKSQPIIFKDFILPSQHLFRLVNVARCSSVEVISRFFLRPVFIPHGQSHTCPILSSRFQWTKPGVRRSLVEK